MMLMMACLHTFCIFIRVAAFSISLVNDKTETVVPALDSMFMKSIVDVAIYKENTLKVTIFLEHIVITLRVSKIKVSLHSGQRKTQFKLSAYATCFTLFKSKHLFFCGLPFLGTI